MKEAEGPASAEWSPAAPDQETMGHRAPSKATLSTRRHLQGGIGGLIARADGLVGVHQAGPELVVAPLRAEVARGREQRLLDGIRTGLGLALEHQRGDAADEGGREGG